MTKLAKSEKSEKPETEAKVPRSSYSSSTLSSSSGSSSGSIAIVGATGLVGLEMRKIFDEDPALEDKKLLLFASQARPVENILGLDTSAALLSECQYILNASSSAVAEQIAARLSAGQMLIDNSSAFRMDPSVPLVVPEINGNLLEANPAIVANPNCTAILLCMTLNGFREKGIARVTVATYQAASGAGIKGLEELESQVKVLAAGGKPEKGEVFPFPLAGNVLSHNTPIRGEESMGAGYNEEEWKVIEETRKILDHRHLAISTTCMRVPVKRAHTEAVTVDLKAELTLPQLREVFLKSPGLKIVDDWPHNHFPMPIEAEGQDAVLVGRIRKDPSIGKTFHYILSGDQLRKGAALNAIQILQAHATLKKHA